MSVAIGTMAGPFNSGCLVLLQRKSCNGTPNAVLEPVFERQGWRIQMFCLHWTRPAARNAYVLVWFGGNVMRRGRNSRSFVSHPQSVDSESSESGPQQKASDAGAHQRLDWDASFGVFFESGSRLYQSGNFWKVKMSS